MATATAKKKTGKVKKSEGASWGGISGEAVKKATGCDWKAWLFVLDRAGCAKMSHKEIAALVYERWPKVGGWWSQMVTVGYEQARGLRATNQSCTGDWQVSSTKTIDVPVKELFRAWSDAKQRAKWLPDPKFTVRKSTEPKSMRITWVDGETSVEANFYSKGATKSSVALQHSKLRDEKHVAKMRTYWGKALLQLKDRLEG